MFIKKSKSEDLDFLLVGYKKIFLSVLRMALNFRKNNDILKQILLFILFG